MGTHEGPEALPTLLHDRLLTNAPSCLSELVWPAQLPETAVATLEGHGRVVSSVAVLPDGRVVPGSEDLARMGRRPSPLSRDGVSSVAVLPDGRVVSGSRDKTLRVWDLESGHATDAGA
jgi:WD40 repeat protein